MRRGLLEGKKAVILGASSGIGKRIAERYVEEGAQVVAAARRMELLEVLATDTGCMPVRCDAREDGEIQGLIRTSVEHLGKIDVAVYCAGIARFARVADLTPEILHEVAAVQFFGAYYFIRHAANAMALTGGGALILITSNTAIIPGEGLAAYSGCKAAINFVTKIAALEYGPRGVRVNAVAPGFVPTAMNNYGTPATHKAFIEETPLRRIITVDDCADVAVLMASDLSRSMTGQVIPVDGGNFLQKLPSHKQRVAIAARLAAGEEQWP